MKKLLLAVSALLVCYCVAVAFLPVSVKAGGIGAADYTITGAGIPSQVITIATGSVKNVLLLDGADYTLVHLNIQNDGSTASVSTDYVVVMNNQTQAGAAVTMDATYTDGIKMIVGAGANATFNASRIPAGADGAHEIQLQAVGHGAKMQLIQGHFSP